MSRIDLSSLWYGLLRWRWQAAGLGLVAAFAVLAGRFWHPYYGFTKFVQLDEYDAHNGIREMREQPVFVYPGFGGYDGAAYTQIAFHPLLDSSELTTAVDSLAYRARRILGSAIAWLLAGGGPSRIANTYAGLNLVVWLALAMLLWRVLPVTDARSWIAWAGVLFSAGALHSVRLALTDLLATTLITAAIWLGERGRLRGALGVLAVSGLARETALVGIVALCRAPWNTSRAWMGNAVRAAVVAVPLLAWMLYVRSKTGPAAQGFGNFTWPVVAWIEKWTETMADYDRNPEFGWLITTTLLVTIALTVQAIYLIRCPRWADAWWRAGAVWAVMLALLGTSVWEGHPGAASRVVLPMSVAFAVLVVRERAGWRWVTAGGLSVFSGVLALWHVPSGSLEIAAGRGSDGAYVAQIESASGWFGVEQRGRAVWSWAGDHGVLVIDTAPRTIVPLHVRLKLRAITPRELEVRQGEAVLFQGTVPVKSTWIDLSAVAPQAPGRLRLELRSAVPPVRENETTGARALGFALQGVEVK